MNDVAIATSNAVDFAATGDLSEEERPLLHELIRLLRTIRYGPISLTVHNGRLVEIHHTEKTRRRA
jgi:hypothetical protein